MGSGDKDATGTAPAEGDEPEIVGHGPRSEASGEGIAGVGEVAADADVGEIEDDLLKKE